MLCRCLLGFRRMSGAFMRGRIAAESGHVDRLIHFSDMGADLNHKSLRMSTKALGDLAVREAFPSATIMR